MRQIFAIFQMDFIFKNVLFVVCLKNFFETLQKIEKITSGIFIVIPKPMEVIVFLGIKRGAGYEKIEI